MLKREALGMASEAASYHEDVEQLHRRFVEFRQTHAVRSRPARRVVERGGEAGAAGRDHSYGTGANLCLGLQKAGQFQVF